MGYEGCGALSRNRRKGAKTLAMPKRVENDIARYWLNSSAAEESALGTVNESRKANRWFRKSASHREEGQVWGIMRIGRLPWDEGAGGHEKVEKARNSGFVRKKGYGESRRADQVHLSGGATKMEAGLGVRTGPCKLGRKGYATSV